MNGTFTLSQAQWEHNTDVLPEDRKGLILRQFYYCSFSGLFNI